MNAPKEGRAVALATLTRALVGGIRFIDTSETYGADLPDGGRLSSEELIREAIRGWNRAEELILCTKGHGYDADSCMERLHASLKRLGIEGKGGDRHIGNTRVRLIYLLHALRRERWEAVQRSHVVDRALKPALAEGIIDLYGFSGHDHGVLHEGIHSGWFQCVELRYSAFQRHARQTRGDTGSAPTALELIEEARKQGLGIINMKPFGGNSMQDILSAIHHESAYLAHGDLLRYCLGSGRVDMVIPGARTPEEVEECLRASAEPPLTEVERDRLERAADRVVEIIGGNYCRACRHCVEDAGGFECPQGIDFIEILVLDSRRRMAEALSTDAEPFRAAYTALPVNATDCIQCGGCEERCPYQIPVMEMLQDAHIAMKTAGNS
jgi:predicted aldo/keto reductase-like oxidoreductase